jgi:lipopolysaccharide transport system permease protein
VLSCELEVALIARNESHPVAFYMPGSALKSSLALIRQLAGDSVRSRHVTWEMFKRDLTSQYRQSILGVLFSLLPPLAITALAILLRRVHLINVGRSGVPYPFFVLCGMMVWAAFLEALDAPISGLLSDQSLLSKASIPPEAVTFARLGQVFFKFSVNALAVSAAAIFYRIHVSWTATLAPLNCLYRDMSKGLLVTTIFWLFLTPIIFVSPRQGIASVIMYKIDPVTQILMAMRDLIFPGTGGTREGPIAASIFALTLFYAALVFHRVAMPVVLDRANS